MPPSPRPLRSLPLPPEYDSEETYVQELLAFVSGSDLLQLMTGGVHILDFFTRSPDLYSWLLPGEWRAWFANASLQDAMDLILHDDVGTLLCHAKSASEREPVQLPEKWNERPLPSQSLLEYIYSVRRLLLDRSFQARAQGGCGVATGTGKQKKRGQADRETGFTRQVAVGMKEKKIHEVFHFSRFIHELVESLEPNGNHQDRQDTAATSNTAKLSRSITHLVDFGSGQNYLGRALASEPINRNVVAVESRPHNIEGAKKMDITARLAAKQGILRNKKAFRAGQQGTPTELASPLTDLSLGDGETDSRIVQESEQTDGKKELGEWIDPKESRTILKMSAGRLIQANIEPIPQGQGTVQHVEHHLAHGDLSQVVGEIVDPLKVSEAESNLSNVKDELKEGADTGANGKILSVERLRDQKPSLMVIGLHSCGNLTHHGIRSLLLTPEVSAVAIVGCCYNLATERLTPPSYKMPGLRPLEDRASANGAATTGDPQGFPMSKRLSEYTMSDETKGIHFNITSRMMAAQAPQNWGPTESDGFFTRHFYRALLQRIFLDHGVVDRPSNDDGMTRGYNLGGRSAAGTSSTNGQVGGSTQPIIIGSLRKSCYVSFVSYFRAALAKLSKDLDRGHLFREKLSGLTDAQVAQYETDFLPSKKELSIIWTLMAYSAGLVEAVIVVDRWQWLREQPEVRDSWVQPVFEYSRSPRNLVVVGIK